jgi:hypothetical protein
MSGTEQQVTDWRIPDESDSSGGHLIGLTEGTSF